MKAKFQYRICHRNYSENRRSGKSNIIISNAAVTCALACSLIISNAAVTCALACSLCGMVRQN